MGPATRADRVMLHDPIATPNSAFPNLTPANHRVIGPATDTYNCIAWACGDTQKWWQPGPKTFWPVSSDPYDTTTANLFAALAAVGFVVCPDEALESGFEKIAVYAQSLATYTHAARLLPNGKWTSKLGDWELIEHDAPQDVAGGIYGTLFQFMKRPMAES
jgi:hypothetical protein